MQQKPEKFFVMGEKNFDPGRRLTPRIKSSSAVYVKIHRPLRLPGYPAPG